MADVVSPEVRSRMMSGIRGKNTKPEVMVRKALHAAGFRFRLNASYLPGKPDIVLRKHRAVIFVHGCFWHGHDCHLFKWPRTRPEFWRAKIKGNADRDSKAEAALAGDGWRVGVVWECSLKGRTRRSPEDIVKRLSEWLRYGGDTLQISGLPIPCR